MHGGFGRPRCGARHRFAQSCRDDRHADQLVEVLRLGDRLLLDDDAAFLESLQPLIDISAKSNGFTAFPAQELIFAAKA